MEEEKTEFSFPGDFPSLANSFGNGAKAPMIGLLFSAGWCDDCQAKVPKLADLLKEVDAASTIEIFYVSSENSEEEMDTFISSFGGASLFQKIMFCEGKERDGLKLHFQTCAKKEMADVGVETRKSGIPTLKIFKSNDASILVEDAMDDVEKLPPAEAMEKWKKLAMSEE